MVKAILGTLSPQIVVILFTIAPFWALGQNHLFLVPQTQQKMTPSVNPQDFEALKKKAIEEMTIKYGVKNEPYTDVKGAFQLKTPKYTNKLLKHGGGVVDGGGGNTSSLNNELLDHALYADLQKLESQELKETLESVFGSRLNELRTSLPRFQEWLDSGFSKPWYLDTKAFNKEICPRAASGTCQTADAVHINADRYKQATNHERAQIIILELIKYHSLELPNDTAGKTATEIRQTMLNSRVKAEDFFSLLVKKQLLLPSEPLEATRAALVRHYDELLKPLRENTFPTFLQSCPNSPFSISKTFHKTIGQYMEFANRCAAWLKPEVDGEACDMDKIAEFMVQFQLYCSKN